MVTPIYIITSSIYKKKPLLLENCTQKKKSNLKLKGTKTLPES